MTTNDLLLEISQLKADLNAAQQQIDWFKRQLFGRKSENLIEPNPHQTPLFQALPAAEKTPETEEVKGYKRRSVKHRSDDDVNDTGLRFDETVPQKIIDIPAPELKVN